MWEPKRIKRYEREIAAIADAVTDPEDIAVILALEARMARVKADAVRRLRQAGYSNRDVARATGRDEKAVRKWLAQYPA